MMYKKRIIIYMCFFFILLVPNSVVYGAQIGLEDADILIIYGNRISTVNIKNIETMIKSLTYQNYSIAYGSIDECKGALSGYKNIICYDLDGQDESLMTELIGIDSNIMIIGNNIIESYIKQKGLNVNVTKTLGKSALFTYSFSEQQEFNSLIDVNNPYILEGDITYISGTYELNGIEQGFCIGNDKLRYIPTTKLEDTLVQSAFTNELARWMWPYNGEPHTYAQYIVFDKVYPFTNLEQMLIAINAMIELDTPFIISVMPLYQNGDYPSMKRFCEVLRYAQANGGAIILHAPIIQNTNLNVEEIREYITIATEAYTNNGVYPIGIEAPAKWLFDKQGQEILRRYRTVMIYEEENGVINLNLTDHFNHIYKDGHQIIGPSISIDESGSSRVKSYSSAVYMNILEDVDILKSYIQDYKDSIVPIKSLWEFSNVVYTNSSIIEYKKNILTLNGKQVSLDYKPSEFEKNYEYKRDIMSRITVDLENQNKKLISAVSVALILFIIFIIVARNANKKKFFYPKEK